MQLFYATKNDRKKYAQSDKHKSQPQNKDVVAEPTAGHIPTARWQVESRHVVRHT